MSISSKHDNRSLSKSRTNSLQSLLQKQSSHGQLHLCHLGIDRSDLSILDAVEKPQGVASLDLSRNKFHLFCFDKIGHLENLSCLSLASCSMSNVELPGSGSLCFPLMVSLDLSYNPLSDLPHHFPLVFPRLEKLLLNGCQLSSLSFPLPGSIHVLEAEHNVIERIADDMFIDMFKLRVLKLGGNRLTRIPSHAIATSCTMLEEISLFSNQLSSIGDSLAERCNLKRVVLTDNPLQVLPPSLFVPPSLYGILQDLPKNVRLHDLWDHWKEQLPEVLFDRSSTIVNVPLERQKNPSKFFLEKILSDKALRTPHILLIALSGSKQWPAFDDSLLVHTLNLGRFGTLAPEILLLYVGHGCSDVTLSWEEESPMWIRSGWRRKLKRMEMHHGSLVPSLPTYVIPSTTMNVSLSMTKGATPKAQYQWLLRALLESYYPNTIVSFDSLLPLAQANSVVDEEALFEALRWWGPSGLVLRLGSRHCVIRPQLEHVFSAMRSCMPDNCLMPRVDLERVIHHAWLDSFLEAGIIFTVHGDAVFVPCFLDVKPNLCSRLLNSMKVQDHQGRRYRFDHVLPRSFRKHVLVHLVVVARTYFEGGDTRVVVHQDGLILQTKDALASLSITPSTIIAMLYRGADCTDLASPRQLYALLVSSAETVIREYGAQAKHHLQHVRSQHVSEWDRMPLYYVVEAESNEVEGWRPLHTLLIDQRRMSDVLPEFNHVTSVQWGDVCVGDIICRGIDANIFKGHLDGKAVAIKRFVDPQDESDDLAPRCVGLLRESALLGKLSHENIVEHVGVSIVPPAMLCEYLDKGDMACFLRTQPSAAIRYAFAKDIARGMKYLHDQVPIIIHRDLRPQNVFVRFDETQGRPIAKVGDMGNALLRTPNAASLCIDNPIWSAPELQHQRMTESTKRRGSGPAQHVSTPKHVRTSCLSNGNFDALMKIQTETTRTMAFYDESVDVYSFGVLLWHLYVLKAPWSEYRFFFEIADAVVAGRRPPIPVHCPSNLSSLISSCWHAEPAKRPSFAEISEILLDAPFE